MSHTLSFSGEGYKPFLLRSLISKIQVKSADILRPKKVEYMGHLGEGTKITTVSALKVVLTDSKGQNFIMEISDLGEIIKTDAVRKKHSLSVIDCNTLMQTMIISGYQWTNAPKNGIAILEILVYSQDWVFQRFTIIGSSPQIWVRSFSNGKIWGDWSLV